MSENVLLRIDEAIEHAPSSQGGMDNPQARQGIQAWLHDRVSGVFEALACDRKALEKFRKSLPVPRLPKGDRSAWRTAYDVPAVHLWLVWQGWELDTGRKPPARLPCWPDLDRIPKPKGASRREVGAAVFLSCLSAALRAFPQAESQRFRDRLRAALIWLRQRLTGDGADNKRSRRRRPLAIETPQKDFTFEPGQALFEHRDLGLPSGLPVDVLERLADACPKAVKHNDLDNSEEHGNEAGEKLRGAISSIRQALRRQKIPYTIMTKRGEGYALQPA
jgi:hypothetical protein